MGLACDNDLRALAKRSRAHPRPLALHPNLVILARHVISLPTPKTQTPQKGLGNKGRRREARKRYGKHRGGTGKRGEPREANWSHES